MKSARQLLIVSIIFLPLFSGTGTAETVTTEEVSGLSRQAAKVYNFFMESTFTERAEYIFFGNFSPGNQRKIILKRAEEARGKLLKILNHQKELRKEIENYEGSDWDSLYGANGLWRRLVCDICETGTFKLEIDYYRYLFSPTKEKSQILPALESRLEKQFDCESNWRRLLKARCFFLIGDDEKATQILDELIDSQFTGESIRPRAELLKLKHTGIPESYPRKEINEIAAEITNTGSSKGTEFAISVLGELRKLTTGTELKKTIKEFGKPGECLYSLAERRISNFYENDRISEISPFEVRLACLGFLEGANDFDGKALLNLTENANLRCPLLLYCCSESAENENDSVGYLLECIRLLENLPESWLDIERDTLIRRIIERTYNGLANKSVSCDTGEEVFSFYLDQSPSDGEYKLKFRAGCGLLCCGAERKGKTTLEELWKDKDSGIWVYRARLELLKHKASRLSPDDSDYINLLSEAEDLAGKCSLRSQKGYKELLRKCVNFHCRLLADKGDKKSAEQILKQLTLFETLTDRQTIIKARACAILERYPECLQTLTGIRQPGLQQSADVYYPLYEVISRIEIGEEREILDTEGKQVLLTLAENLSAKLDSREADLLFAEALVSLSDKTDDIKKVDQLTKNINAENETDLLRCRGKLLLAENKFKAAAEKWIAIRNIIKNTYPESYRKNWFWWQSRYYEFLCWSKLPSASSSEIVRVIEVLENSAPDPPFPWGGKLSTLKNGLKTGITVN